MIARSEDKQGKKPAISEGYIDWLEGHFTGCTKEINRAPGGCNRAAWFISTLAASLGFENQVAHKHDDLFILELLPNKHSTRGRFCVRFWIDSFGRVDITSNDERYSYDSIMCCDTKKIVDALNGFAARLNNGI